MTLQVSIRPQKEGDAIFILEGGEIVNKGTSPVYSDNHEWHTVAAAAPDANLRLPLSEFTSDDKIVGETRGGAVIFSVEQDNLRAVIQGMSKRAGDTLPLKGMIFSVEQASQVG